MKVCICHKIQYLFVSPCPPQTKIADLQLGSRRRIHKSRGGARVEPDPLPSLEVGEGEGIGK